MPANLYVLRKRVTKSWPGVEVGELIGVEREIVVRGGEEGRVEGEEVESMEWSEPEVTEFVSLFSLEFGGGGGGGTVVGLAGDFFLLSVSEEVEVELGAAASALIAARRFESFLTIFLNATAFILANMTSC